MHIVEFIGIARAGKSIYWNKKVRQWIKNILSMKNKSLKRVHPPAFKARVAIEAIKGEKTLAELTSIYGIHHSMIIKWKQAVLAGLESIFSDKRKLKEEDDRELISELYRQIGRLKVEVDFLKKKMGIFEGRQ